jgi:acetate kinase
MNFTRELSECLGLMMGTRSGDIDPGAMSYMSRVTKLSLDKIEEMLNKDSGLKGICDTSDLREVMKMIQGDDKEKKERAQLALDMFCYRIKKYIGAYYVAMDGALDYLVFTAGIGENSAVVREMVCDGLKCIGVRVDKSKNECVNSGDEVTEIN